MVTAKYDADKQMYYRPADVHTKNTMNYKYGYIEMRAKLPLESYTWSSFWMQSVVDNKDALAQPKTNLYKLEVDVFETLDKNDRMLVGNIHKWYMKDTINDYLSSALGISPDHPDYKTEYDRVKNEQLLETHRCKTVISKDEYHIIGMEWTENYIRMFVDGELKKTYEISNLGSVGKMFDENEVTTSIEGFHEPLFVIIGTGIKNALPLRNDSSSYDFCVDWIRLYQKDPVKDSTIWD